MGKFIGIDEILQGGTPNRPTHSTPKEGKKGEALARTSLEYPLELHRKVKKYAVDAGMKEKYPSLLTAGGGKPKNRWR